MIKKCKDCCEEKDLSEYYGNQGDCKDCFKRKVRKNRLKNKEYYEAYDRQRNREDCNRMWLRRYSMMKQRVEGRAVHYASSEGKGLMSKKEFMSWCNSTKDVFIGLQSAWIESGHERKMAPSIDRIDDGKGYIHGNLQWITAGENSRKSPSDNWTKLNRDEKGRFLKKSNSK